MKHSVTEHKLAGGTKGLVVHVPNTPVVSLEITFNSGFQFGPADKFELSHVFEHLMGTSIRPSYPKHNGIFIAIGQNGAYTNAYTSSTTNGYVIDFASFEMDRMLDILGEYLISPKFTEEGLTGEIGNVREELSRNTTNYDGVGLHLLLEKVYPGRYLNYDTRMSQLDKITVEDAQKFYERTHTQQNARIYLAGDFPDGGAMVMDRLEGILSKLPIGNRAAPNQDMGLELPAPIWQHHDLSQTNYRVGLYFGELSYRDRASFALMRNILVGGFAARIYGKARLKGLAYGVGGSGGTSPGHSSFSIHGHVTPASAKELFTLIGSEMRNLRSGDLKDAELTAAKDRVIGSSVRAHQRASDFMDWYSGPYDDADVILDFDEYMKLLREVTVEDVIRVARLTIADGRHGTSFVGPVDEALAGQYADLLKPVWTD